MDRKQATQILRDEMNKHGLQDWHVRLNQNPDSRFLGLCSYKDKCIILSAHHIDIHPDPDVINTIRHEIAHALCPGHAHDYVWAEKAREIGCDNTSPCSNLSLSPNIIDAIRSGADVEVTFTEQVIRTPQYKVTRLQDKCEKCGKVAVEKSFTTTVLGKGKFDIRFILLECGHTITKQIPKGTPFGDFQSGGDPKCKHKWDKNKCLKCGRFRPYDFQIVGMQFAEQALASGKGCLIADQMGLGKTNQAMGVVEYHPEICTPTLWTVKSGLKYQFFSALVSWTTDGELTQIITTSKDRLWKGMKHYIIGYDMMTPKTRTLKSGKVVQQGFDIRQFNHIGGVYDSQTDTWTGGESIKCVVLDECQQIKNVDSTRTQQVRKVVRDKKVIALSGTPWNNRGSELFPVLNMISPLKFSSAEQFKRYWVSYYYSGQYLKEGGIKNIDRFKDYTKDIIIRRERTEVLKELPLVNRTKLNVVMNETDEAIYDEAVEEFVKWYEEQSGDISGMNLLAAMAKMRHLVGLTKIPATLEYVDEFVEDTDRKIAIFAHHIDVQTILYEELKQKYGEEFPVLKYSADMNSLQRNDAVETFNKSPKAIMVMSQGAGGEGLNLQTCCDTIMHERQWNPGREEQCEDRFVRIGSTAQSVNAIYTHMEGLTAIDATLDSIVERKRIQYHQVMNKGQAQVWNEDALIKELASAIVNAHNAKKNRKVLTGAK